MKRMFRKFRRYSLYKKSLICFVTILIGIGILFLTYVYKSMITYERNLVDNYIAYLGQSGKLFEDSDDLFEVSKLEKNNTSISKGLKKLFSTDKIKYKKNSKLSSETDYVYDLYLDDLNLGNVTLVSKDTYTKMAILSINEWEVKNIDLKFDKGLYFYEITIPENYKLYINDSLVSKDYITSSGDVPGLDRLTKYVEISKSNTYEVDKLVNEPDIKILDNTKKEVKYKIDGNKIKVEKEFVEVKNYSDMDEYLKTEFDVLGLAKNWSLFLTDDLGGSSHGYHKFTPYLIKNSYMYEMAYGWAHNVDITFVSKHTLKNPVFTNEEVKNCIVYNDLAFSCEVYLEKNMTVKGEDRVDVMHDRMYFVYYDSNYKLVNMESI